MKICVLCSGSKGNCIYVEINNIKILFDSGKNYKYISGSLAKIGVSIKNINYIFITHTHTDHISSLPIILKNSNATLCITQKLFYELKELSDFSRLIIFDKDIKIQDINITAIKSSHDAIDSQNYLIEYNNQKIAYITDTGYLHQKHFKKLNNADLYLMESNHDIEMLKNGPYPKWLQNRVVGDEGHLSNKQAGFYLSKLIGSNTKKVILIHLSEVNNTPEIALDTVKEMLSEYEIEFSNISYAMQEEISEVIIID